MKDAGQIKNFKHYRITGLMGLPNDGTLPAKRSGCRKLLIPMNN